MESIRGVIKEAYELIEQLSKECESCDYYAEKKCGPSTCPRNKIITFSPNKNYVISESVRKQLSNRKTLTPQSQFYSGKLKERIT